MNAGEGVGHDGSLADGNEIIKRRSATAAMLRITGPWLESHGYHHASAPRVANWNRVAMTDGNRGIYPTDGNGEGKWNRVAMI
jgi:hypothetical protein